MEESRHRAEPPQADGAALVSGGDDSPRRLDLTAAQRGMWFAEHLSSDHSVNLAHYLDIRYLPGEFDHELFARCNEEIGKVVESPYLRLVDTDGVPGQIIDVDYDQHVDIVDLRSEPDPPAAAMTWMRAEYMRPINLLTDQLIVIALLRVADDRTFWYGRGHHIIIDGYGAMNLLRMSVDRYNAARRGIESVEKRVATMAEIVADEQKYLDGPRRQKDREHWRAVMANVPKRVTLSRQPGASGLSSQNPVATSTLSPEFQSRLEEVAADLGSSMAMILAAAYGAFLYRMTGNDDVLISLPVTGRSSATIKRAGGMLSNILPVRMSGLSTVTVGELVHSVQVEMIRALRHQRYRSDDIRRDAGLDAEALGFGPAINMVFFDSPIQIDGACVDYRILTSGIVEDILVNLYQASPGAPLIIDLHGNSLRYGQAEIDSHHRRFMTFVEAFVRDTDSAIRSLPLLLPGEEAQIAAAEGGPAAAAAHDPRVLSAFERHVTQTPDAVALISGDRVMTYREFGARVAVLARRLLDAGVGPDVAVAVSTSRSLEMMVAMYAVLSAGGQYVPVDVTASDDRVSQILTTSGSRLLLVHLGATAEWIGVPTWQVDASADVDPATPLVSAAERGAVRPESAFCTLFTAGSTGRTMAVVLGHETVRNRLEWGIDRLGLSAGDVVLRTTPYTVDRPAVELFAPLMVGATLVLSESGDTPEDGVAHARRVLSEIERTAATAVHFESTVFAEFLEATSAAELAAPTSVRVVSTTGETPSAVSVAAVGQNWPTIDLHTFCGPAEAAVEITWAGIGRGGQDEITVPIGIPAPNSSSLVLDDRLQRVPVGVVGELYLGGPHLARGYEGRPDLTADRFVANPYGAIGDRLYRTGHLVRRLPDGRIEYLGRIDHREIQFWTDELADLGEVEYLPTDRSRPAVATGRGEHSHRVIPAGTVETMTRLATRLRVTPFDVLHAGLAVVLARVSGQSDIAVATAVAGRGAPHLAAPVGRSVNTVVLRTEVTPRARFEDVVTAARDVAARAFRHSEVPFEQIVEAAAPGRSRPGVPLFQVMTHWQRNQVSASASVRDAGPTDLLIELNEVGGPDGPVVQVGMTYSRDLFDPETVEEFADQYLRVIDALVTDPQTTVATVDLLPPDRVRELTRARPSVEPRTFRDLVLDLETRRDRSRIAISGADRVERSLFETHTNQIARELINRGIGPGDVVAIAIGRSADSVIATFAVVKTGAAFVSIDPRYPADRQRAMVSDSGAVIGLYASAVGSLGVGPWPDMTWIDLSDPEDECQLAGHSGSPIRDDELVRRPKIDDLAYLIYTSGSTGVPKAAAITHRGLHNFTVNQLDKFGLTSADKVLHVSSPSFDASVLELLSAIGSGAELVVAPVMVYAGAELEALVAEHGATHVFLTPSVLATIDPARVPSVRNVMVGGEAVPQEMVRRWAESAGRRTNRRLFIVYGPTENTIYSVWTDALTDPNAPVTLGHALTGVGAYVLDECLRPTPDGVPGQLYLAGPQLAAGYHKRPGLTSRVFLANPFVHGERMYATGDRVVRARSGELVFRGRLDFQLKIRGQRVEPGEIDAVLLRHREVGNAVTVGVPGPGGQMVLVSYAQLVPDSAVTAEELTSHLAQRLPAHMVPQRIVFVGDFALTAVGKIDRKLLPEVDVSPAAEFLAPRTELEAVVAKVFADVLGVERVGVDVGFFEAGGNSLAAVKLASALSETTGHQIPVRTLLESSSVEAIAAYVENSAGAADEFPLVPQPRPDRIPVSEVQRGMWLLNRTDPDSPAYNIGFALRLSGKLDPAMVQAAAADLVARQTALRTYYPMVDGDPTQRVVPPADVLAALDLDPVDAFESPLQLVESIVCRGFDVTSRPPFRMALLRTGDDEHIVVFVIHHISADGSSLRSLALDFLASARARAQGHAPAFTPLSVDYLDFSLWQRARLGAVTEGGGNERDRQLNYWRTRLAGAPEQLRLPTDRSRPPAPSFVGASVDFSIPADLVSRLEKLSRGLNVTLFDVMHSAYAVFLGRMAGVDDVVIGTAFAGRVAPALDDLVGMFVNSLPLRTQLRPAEAFDDLVGRVHAEDIEDMANADVAFESMVEATGIRRSSAFNPVFQAMLLFQNFEFPVVELPGLTISVVEEAFTAAQVDLQLTVYPTDPLQLGAKVSGAPMRAAFIYATDLFDAETIERYGERFLAVLEAVAADSAVKVGDISIATGADQVRPADDDAPVISLPDFVEGRAAAEPDRIAVRYGENIVTFGDLSTMTTVMTASLPDADSALITALMSLLPDLASADPEALSEVLTSIRRIDA